MLHFGWVRSRCCPAYHSSPWFLPFLLFLEWWSWKIRCLQQALSFFFLLIWTDTSPVSPAVRGTLCEMTEGVKGVWRWHREYCSAWTQTRGGGGACSLNIGSLVEDRLEMLWIEHRWDPPSLWDAPAISTHIMGESETFQRVWQFFQATEAQYKSTGCTSAFQIMMDYAWKPHGLLWPAKGLLWKTTLIYLHQETVQQAGSAEVTKEAFGAPCCSFINFRPKGWTIFLQLLHGSPAGYDCFDDCYTWRGWPMHALHGLELISPAMVWRGWSLTAPHVGQQFLRVYLKSTYLSELQNQIKKQEEFFLVLPWGTGGT